jgi:hypothetical protein
LLLGAAGIWPVFGVLGVALGSTACPHAMQNRAVSATCDPHELQNICTPIAAFYWPTAPHGAHVLILIVISSRRRQG